MQIALSSTSGPPPTPLAGTPAVEVHGLTKRYGTRAAVNDLSFTLIPGRVTGFLGPNGAGKTTTIRMLLGLATPTAGTIEVFGESSTHPERYLQRVGALIEGPAFIPALSARENLRMFAVLGGHVGRIDAVIERVGLQGREHDAVRGYSLGMKQRLGIAAALLPDPDLLVLDEPTNGLDPAGIQEIRELLRELAGEGRTVFVSSHLLSEIQTICDDLLVVREGSHVYSGTVEGLLASRGATIRLRPERTEDLAWLRRGLSSAGIESSPTGGVELIVDAASGVSTAELNRLATGHGITLSELRTEQPDLEATFLELTSTAEATR